MGGYGSGQRWSKKAVVEGCHSIDTTKLKQWKLLMPGVADRAGAFEWRRGGGEKPSSSVGYRLTVGRDAGTLRLLYAVGSASQDYTVRLVTTACHLGGARWWFVCPLVVNGRTCGRRVRKLYLRGNYFGCRHCHKLAYTSSQESDSRAYALLRAGIGRPDDIRGMPLPQLALTLKALRIEQKRLDRWLGDDRRIGPA